MCRYGLLENYLQLKDKDQNKGAMLYIDERPKKTRNIAGFIKVHNQGPHLSNPTAYCRGFKETVYSYVPLNQ